MKLRSIVAHMEDTSFWHIYGMPVPVVCFVRRQVKILYQDSKETLTVAVIAQ